MHLGKSMCFNACAHMTPRTLPLSGNSTSLPVCACVCIWASVCTCHSRTHVHALPHPPWQLSPPPHLSPHSSSSWGFSLSLLEGSTPAPACHTQGHQPCREKAEKPEFLEWRTRKKQKAGDPPSEPTPGEPCTLPQHASGQGPQARWGGCGLRGMPGFASSSMTLPG